MTTSQFADILMQVIAGLTRIQALKLAYQAGFRS